MLLEHDASNTADLSPPAHEDEADHTDQMLALWRQKHALHGGTGPIHHRSSTPTDLRASSSASGPPLVHSDALALELTPRRLTVQGSVVVQCRVRVSETCDAVTRAVRQEQALSPSSVLSAYSEDCLEPIAASDDLPYFYTTVDDYLDSCLSMPLRRVPSSPASWDVTSVSEVSADGEDHHYSTSSSLCSGSSSDDAALLPEDGAIISEWGEQEKEKPGMKAGSRSTPSSPRRSNSAGASEAPTQHAVSTTVPDPTTTRPKPDLKNAGVAEHHPMLLAMHVLPRNAEGGEYFQKEVAHVSDDIKVSNATIPEDSPAAHVNGSKVAYHINGLYEPVKEKPLAMATWFSELGFQFLFVC